MIKIYIQNYFMENMFHKKIKLIITKRWNCTNRKIKGIRYCIIIEKNWLSLIDKIKNKL